MKRSDIIPDKMYVPKVQKFTFADPEMKHTIGEVKSGNYLGDLLGKTKAPNSDSYMYKFRYPKKYQALVPNSNGAAYNPQEGASVYYILAEPDEIEFVAPKTIGLTPALVVANAGEKVIEAKNAVVDAGKSLMKGVVTIMLLLLVATILINKITK